MSVNGIGATGYPATGYYGVKRPEKKSVETDWVSALADAMQT